VNFSHITKFEILGCDPQQGQGFHLALDESGSEEGRLTNYAMVLQWWRPMGRSTVALVGSCTSRGVLGGHQDEEMRQKGAGEGAHQMGHLAAAWPHSGE
jgi:hypothetical protein